MLKLPEYCDSAAWQKAGSVVAMRSQSFLRTVMIDGRLTCPLAVTPVKMLAGKLAGEVSSMDWIGIRRMELAIYSGIIDSAEL